MAYFKKLSGSDFYLFTLDLFRTEVEVSHLDWYDDSYDKGDQGIVGVTEVPGTEELLFSVQRSSELVRYDLGTRKALGRINLGARSGNPTLHFSVDGRNLWADDYDPASDRSH